MHPDQKRKSQGLGRRNQMQETLAWLGTLTKEQRQELEAKFP